MGKSNVVVNLGMAFARMGRKVLLIDADLGLANLDILLGLSPRFTIQDLLSLRRSLPEVLVEGPEGIKVLPASSGIPELADLDKHQKMSAERTGRVLGKCRRGPDRHRGRHLPKRPLL